MDEIELEENDDFEQNFKALDGHDNDANKNENGTRTSFTDKNKESSEEDEVNVDEEDDEEGKKNTVHKPNITVKVTNTKASKHVQPAPSNSNLIPDEHLYDFSILDELFGLIDPEEEEVEPILYGYFNKIVQAMLGKIKPKLLYYLLVKREGQVFPRLLRLMQHHSLAQLLVELMQVELPP